MKKHVFTGLPVLLCAFALVQPCLADSPNTSRFLQYSEPSPTRILQRTQYKEASRLIQLGKKNQYQKLKNELRSYPLYPYLEYTEIMRGLSIADKDSVTGFVERYKDTPLARQLKRNWLQYLAKRNLWTLFSDNYDDTFTTTGLECTNAFSLHQLGQKKAAFDAAAKLWTVSHSQKDACDPVFKVWQEAGNLTSDIALQRFEKALSARNLTLASYLMRYMSRKDALMAKTFKRVHVRPRTLAAYSNFRANNSDIRKIILHGLQRLSRSDAKLAIDYFARYRQSHTFTQEEIENISRILGTKLASQSRQLAKLNGLPIEITQYPEIMEAVLRNHLKQQNWSIIGTIISSLPETLQSNPRWQYWKARALSLSQDEFDRSKAFQLFFELSHSRSFYGFLAADSLGQPYEFEDTPIVADERSILAREQLPGIQRALELFALEERTKARREWTNATRKFSDKEQVIAAHIAARRGWHKQAIQSMIVAKAWDDLSLRFPLAFHETFIRNANKSDIPLDWSLAIARQESAFMPDARSSSGALGIMQLIPTTARHTARKLGVRYRSRHDLLKPRLNIKLGAAYLGMMLKRFNNNRILASAAYNAGPRRVEQWLDDSLPYDIWIETIPFKETRQYVQNVLMFSTIYGRHLSQEDPIIYHHERADFGKPVIRVSTTPAAVTAPVALITPDAPKKVRGFFPAPGF